MPADHRATIRFVIAGYGFGPTPKGRAEPDRLTIIAVMT